MRNRRILYLLVIAALLLLLFNFPKPGSDGSVQEVYRDTANLIYTRHAKCRMDCRHIDADEIKEVIETGKLNKEKSGPGKSGDDTYALEGRSKDGQQIRVVVTPETNGLLVITVIDLETEWPCHCE